MEFKISNEAEIDLEKIWNYIFETWSVERSCILKVAGFSH